PRPAAGRTSNAKALTMTITDAACVRSTCQMREHQFGASPSGAFERVRGLTLALGLTLGCALPLAGQVLRTRAPYPSAGVAGGKAAPVSYDSSRDSAASRPRKNYIVPAFEIVGFEA